MTDLKAMLTDVEEGIAPAPEDYESVRSKGARTLRRRRFASAFGGLSAVVAVVVVASLVDVAAFRKSDQAPAGPGAANSWSEWSPIATAPLEARYDAHAVWTGDEFLIWGGSGQDQAFQDGAGYSPTSDEWRELPRAPIAQGGDRTSVWTGRELLLWGGETTATGHSRPDDGAGYNPSSNRWREIEQSPVWSLAGHAAVWTGSEMIVWGGVDNFDTGAAYDPARKSWREFSPAPIAGRSQHAAVWTGNELIVWGGRGEYGEPLADGAAYSPDSDTWRILSEAPLAARTGARVVWTGSKMIVWGGDARTPGADLEPLSDGAIYDPQTDSWTPIADAPTTSVLLTEEPRALWTGDRMVVFGVDSAPHAYEPATDTWMALPAHETLPRRGMVVAWTGGEVLAWGGASGEDFELLASGIRTRLQAP